MNNNLALTFLKFIFSVYDMVFRMIQVLQATILRQFNRKVLYIKYVSKTDDTTHCFPTLGIKFMKHLRWDFIKDTDIYHLADVYFVIDAKIQRMMAKGSTLNAIERKVRYEVDQDMIQNLKKKANEYLMIECGGKEITSTYNDVSWSIKQFSAGDLKCLLRLPKNESMDVTGSDFCIETKADHEKL